MQQTVSVPTDHLKHIEQRLDDVETIMRRLLGVIEETTPSEKYTFNELYRSDKFRKLQHEAIKKYKLDAAQLVDPFKTYHK